MYDDEGRLIRSVTTRETEWSPDDVALLIAQMELEAEYGPHGQPMSEATDPNMDPRLPGEHMVYEAYSTQDYAAEELRKAQEKMRADFPDDKSLDALAWGVRRVMRAARNVERNG